MGSWLLVVHLPIMSDEAMIVDKTGSIFLQDILVKAAENENDETLVVQQRIAKYLACNRL
jgi:hypothetical protein